MYERKVMLGGPSTQTTVLAGEGAVDRLTGIINATAPSSVFILTDRNVQRYYGPLFKGLRKDLRCPVEILAIPAGEKTKSYRYHRLILNWLLDDAADRDSVLIGVGGGVICDILGFAAATFMRGVGHILVPTTLLAQIDAAFGGKNGINLPNAKNIVGTIKQPVAIAADPMFLGTLKPHHIADGLAELVKMALIRSRSLGNLISRYQSTPLEHRGEPLSKIIQQAVRLKLDVVRKDPCDRGLRRILNFGHTAGHALESFRGYRGITHGRAVAYGMLVALELSKRLCSLMDDTVAWGYERIGELYRSFPTAHVSSDDLWEIVKRDKKRAGLDVRFVLLESFAKPVFRPVTSRDFDAAFNQVRKRWSRRR